MLDEQDKKWIENLLDTRLKAMETKLLTASASPPPTELLRQLAVKEAIRALDAEVEAIEDRLKKLEGRSRSAGA